MPLIVRSHTPARAVRLLVAALATLVLRGPALHAQTPQTLSFTLIPSVQRVTWDNSLALEDDWLAGARLALRFGPHIELQPFYYTVSGLDLDPDLTDEVFGAPVSGRINDVRHYGANLQWNISRGRLVPFLRAGGGVMRFGSNVQGSQSHIAVSAGGGLRFGTRWLQGEVFAEQLAFRMSPVRLLLPDAPATGRSPSHQNVVYGAALTVPISQVSEPRPGSGGLRGTSAPIEPFIGRVQYDGARGLEDQDFVGVRAGVDFSSLFGIRGFYWRGANDFDGTDPVSGYGGEAQFNLNAGPGIAPFLVIGAGRIDYQSDFDGPLGRAPDDETALILGGGATIRLFDRFGINLAVRDYVMALDQDIDQVSDTDDLTHNTVLSAGLTISIGGSVPEPARPLGPGRRGLAAADSATLDSLRAENERLQRLAAGARQDSLGADIAARARVPSDTLAATDIPFDSLAADSAMRQMMMQPEMAGGRRLVIAPAPMQGEVIFRYGMQPTDASPRSVGQPADAPVTLDQIRDVVRAELGRDTLSQMAQRMPPQPGQPAPTQPVQPTPQPATPQFPQPAPQQVPQAAAPARVDTVIARMPEGLLDMQTFEQRMAAMEARLTTRFESMLNDRLRTLESAAAAQRTAPAQQPLTQRESPGEVEPQRPQAPTFWSRLSDVGSDNVLPFVGADITDGTQLVISGRADLGPLRPGSAFDLVPEVALTFGDGERTLLALANLQYAPFSFGPGGSIRPYVVGGLGLFSETLVAANTGLGASYDTRRGRGVPFLVYAEYQGLNLFEYTRLLFGFSLTR